MIERGRFQKESIPPDVRWAVWERDDFRCHYCGSRSWLSVDHVIAESKGGPMTLSNLVTACQDCNRRKHAKSYESFLRSFQMRDAVTRVVWDREDYDTRITLLEGQAEALQNAIETLRNERSLRYPERHGKDHRHGSDQIQQAEELLGLMSWLSSLEPEPFIQEVARQGGDDAVRDFGQFVHEACSWLSEFAEALEIKLQRQGEQLIQAAD